MAIFWVVAPCRPDDEGSKHLWTSANLHQTTRRNNPEDSHLHTRRRENLKSHQEIVCYYGTGRFITVFTKALRRTLVSASLISALHSKHTKSKTILILVTEMNMINEHTFR
jgi:hypothetical protein